MSSGQPPPGGKWTKVTIVFDDGTAKTFDAVTGKEQPRDSQYSPEQPDSPSSTPDAPSSGGTSEPSS